MHKCLPAEFDSFGRNLIEFDSDSERFKISQNISFKPRLRLCFSIPAVTLGFLPHHSMLFFSGRNLMHQSPAFFGQIKLAGPHSDDTWHVLGDDNPSPIPPHPALSPQRIHIENFSIYHNHLCKSHSNTHHVSSHREKHPEVVFSYHGTSSTHTHYYYRSTEVISTTSSLEQSQSFLTYAPSR
jgi:hypothetical protein